MSRLDGKAVLMTGGGLGIGASTCGAMASEGAAVAVIDVQDDAARETVEQIRKTAAVLACGIWT